jgi:hypothetical protein
MLACDYGKEGSHMTNEGIKTLLVYKRDLRRRGGEHKVFEWDYFPNSTLEYNMEELLDPQRLAAKWPASKGYRYEVHDTYVKRRHALTGVMVEERFNSPWFSSVASESYWSS